MKKKDDDSMPSRYLLLWYLFSIIRIYCGGLDRKNSLIITCNGLDLVFHDLFEMLGIPNSCSLAVFEKIGLGWLKRAGRGEGVDAQ